MAEPARLPPGNPFLSGEPGTHPAFSNNATPEQTGQTITAQFIPSSAAPTAPGSAMAVTPTQPGQLTDAAVPGLFEMTDPTGQGGVTPPAVPLGTGEPGSMTVPALRPDLTKHSTVDLLTPPVESPFIKTGLVTMGSILGGTLGVPAGGGVADVVTVPAGAYLGGMFGSQVYDVGQNIWDAIRGETNDQGEPITIGQQTIDAIQNGTISLVGGWGQVVGRALGEVATTALAPVLGTLGKAAPYGKAAIKAGTAIVGGGAGVGAGTMTVDSSLGFGKLWGLIPPEQRTPDLLQSMKDAWNNAGLDMIVNGALHVPVAVKPGVRTAMYKLFGITPQMVSDAETARAFGINLSMNNVADKSVWAKVLRTVTSVIPIIGHPYRDLENKQIGAINTYSGDLPGRIASPDTTGLPTVEQVGADARSRANSAFRRVAEVYNERFQELVARAKATNVRFSLRSTDGIDADGNPVQSLKDWAGTVLAPAKARTTDQIDLKTGKVIKQPFGKTNVATENKQLLALANKISLSPDVLTVDQLNALGEEADQVFKKFVESGDPTDAKVVALRNSIESFNNSLHGAFTDDFDLNPDTRSHPAIGKMILENDKRYAADRAVFQNATGAKLSKSSIAIPPDILGDTFFKTMDSPTQIDDLRRILQSGPGGVAAGDKIMNDGAATFISDIVSTATQDAGTPNQIFNVNKFAEAIGADNPSSNRYQAVSRALQTSDVKMQDLVNFIKSARIAGQGSPPGFATMLVRKMTFGGFGSIVKTLLPIGAAELGHSVFGPHVSGLSTAGGILLGWKAADIMTNPNYLRDATTFMDTSKGEAERRMAMWRVAKAVLPGDGWQINPPPSDDNKGTGKTPPKGIGERMDKAASQAMDTYFQGSTFLNKVFTQPGSLAQ